MKCYITFLSFVLLIVSHSDNHQPVDACPAYKTEDHKQCYLCGPGYHFVEDCRRNGEQAICRPCPNGQFQRVCNRATSCQPCSTHCKYRHSVIVEQCSKLADIVCHCEEGRYFLSQVGGIEGLCLLYTQCKPGEGVKRSGTAWQDTTCEKCEDGLTFSNVTSTSDPCRPCTSCVALNKVEQDRCTFSNDTQCINKRKQEIQRKITSKPEFLAGVVCGILFFIGIFIFLLIRLLRRLDRLPRWCPKNTRNENPAVYADNKAYSQGQLEEDCGALEHTETYASIENGTEPGVGQQYNEGKLDVSGPNKRPKAAVVDTENTVSYDGFPSSEHNEAVKRPALMPDHVKVETASLTETDAGPIDSFDCYHNGNGTIFSPKSQHFNPNAGHLAINDVRRNIRGADFGDIANLEQSMPYQKLDTEISGHCATRGSSELRSKDQTDLKVVLHNTNQEGSAVGVSKSTNYMSEPHSVGTGKTKKVQSESPKVKVSAIFSDERSIRFITELSHKQDPDKFKPFARELFHVSGISDPKVDTTINQLKHNYEHDVVERQYQFLLKWTHIMGTLCHEDMVVSALKHANDGDGLDFVNAFMREQN